MTAGATLPGGLVAPRYDTGSIAAVLPAAAGVLGQDLTTSTGVGSLHARDALGLPEADRVVVVVVDGLGLRNLAERGGHAPFLRGLLSGSRELTTTFPSTTAAALSVLGTGTSPGRTGLVGYTQRNPATGGLAAMVQWNGAEAPDVVQREPTVHQTLADAGIGLTSHGKARFEGTGLTRAVQRGATYVPSRGLDDAVDAVASALRGRGPDKRLAHLYWDEVDRTGHGHGPDSWQWGDALEATDLELRRLTRSVPRGTVVLVTADHGQIQADLSLQWDVATDPALGPGVALTGGEPRALHLYVQPGVDPAAVAGRWATRLGEHAVVAVRDDAVAAGWFGPVADHVLPSIGDVVVAMTGRATVVDSRVHSAEYRALPGQHGSFTPHEMLVPLLVVQA